MLRTLRDYQVRESFVYSFYKDDEAKAMAAEDSRDVTLYSNSTIYNNEAESQVDQQIEKGDIIPVLIVDDEPMNIFVLQNVLKDRGIDSAEAHDGHQAIAMIKQRVEKVKANEAAMFKLIFLDYSMTDLNGP